MAVCGHRPAEGGLLKPCNQETGRGCPCASEVYAEERRRTLEQNPQGVT